MNSTEAFAQNLTALPPVMQQAALARLNWINKARAKQITPEGAWRVALWLAGRGWGKTETGAQDVAHFGLWRPDSRIAIVAPTFADARDVCVEGVTGLLPALPQSAVAKWNRSIGELDLTNGTKYRLFSSEKPDALRGPQHHRAWCDELAAWADEDTWDMLMLGLRLGEDARAIVTTTPKPTKLLKQLLKRDDVKVIRGSTYENISNLSPTFKAEILARYEGTRLGRQELYAQLLEDAEGALWARENIDKARKPKDYRPELKRIVVAIDPAATDTEASDETGIVVAGLGVDGHGYVLEDLSGRYSPDGWARRAVSAYHNRSADRVVAETNNGGDMIGYALRTMDKHVSYKALTASRGKRTRAEPVAALYEQGKVHHVGEFVKLEEQLCTWEPDGALRSPDRLDALVWALTELMLERTQAVATIPGRDPADTYGMPGAKR